MSEFKDAIFAFESATLPTELQVLQGIVDAFQALPEAATTLIQVAHSLEDAALEIDHFKAKTCGSTYSLALININLLGALDDLKFLMRSDVLGDPRTIFLASLRYMTDDIYVFAKEKVQRESEIRERTPSCIDSYGMANKPETSERIASLIAAYLREAEERAQARRDGLPVFGCTKAEELLRKSNTTFFGKRLKPGHSGIFSSDVSGSPK